MKWLISFLFFGVVTSAPQLNNQPLPPAMRLVLADMLKNVLGNPGPHGFKLDLKPPLPSLVPQKTLAPFFAPVPNFPPQPLPPFQPQPPPGPPGGGVAGNGLFMDLPNSGPGGYAAPMMRSYHYCPPGPTTSDHCKDQKLMEALYHPDGTPRYNWVPPRNPWDNSLPDTVKDTAMHILMMKVNSRPNRTPTPKEWELIGLLGDPKEQGHAGHGAFGMGEC
ncbi:unnamed protein product [Lymnaea stagnalis]|uniref:Uncharacterized protein n=1 Tax=Lymnaea stagnalis TaxID=6523 RepID=A0AAV2H424_LYMST